MKIPLADDEESGFEMTPMIDMVFLLLVFFMCASHLSTVQNVDLEIPTATKAVVPKEADLKARWLAHPDPIRCSI